MSAWYNKTGGIMAFPATYDINYYRGDTLEFNIYPKLNDNSAFDLDGYEVNLFGTGLGTRALGAVNDLDRRILYANWVEFDNARILVEAGLLFLLLIWLAKFLFIVHVSIQKRKMANKERIIVNISLLGLIPYLLFAQIFGQGTMASGVFLIVYILLAFPIRQSTRNI